MAIKSIDLENITVFEKLHIDFVEGVNVIIGENGTGKTHLLKFLCGLWHENDFAENENRIRGLPIGYFGIWFPGLLRNPEKTGIVNISFREGQLMVLGISHEGAELSKSGIFEDGSEGLFLPAKDMLTHSKGFLSLYDKYNLPFDTTCRDIISKAQLPLLRETPAIGEKILPTLEKIMGGKVVVESEVFYIQKNNGQKINFSVEAEGFKKIALLWQLIMNGIITEESILFWDEPEANLNPKMLPDIAELLLELSRHGVQVFVTTHNYFLAKYFQVKKESTDQLLYHSLYWEEGKLDCEQEEEFSLLEHNTIFDQSIKLYEEEVKQVME